MVHIIQGFPLMKKPLQITNFHEIGLITDQPYVSLPLNAITDCLNVDFRSGAVRSSKGYELLTEFPSPFTPLHLTKYETSKALYYVVFDKATAYGFDGTTWRDLTGTAFTGTDDNDWVSDTAGNILIATNGVDAPQYWDHPAGQGTFLSLPWNATESWADKNNKCASIKAFKGFYIAMNITEDTDEYTNRVMWSDPVPSNNVPYWEYTLPTSLSGWLDFDSTDGSIIDGAALNDLFIVFKDHSSFALQFIGGNRVFYARMISSTIGILGRNCSCRVNENLFVLSDNDFFICNGSTFQSVIADKIRKLLFENISSEYYHNSFVVHDPSNREVIVGIVTEGNQFPDLFAVYSYDNNTWAIKSYPIITSLMHSIVNVQDLGSPPIAIDRVYDQIIGSIPKSASANNRLVLFDTSEYFESETKTSSIERISLPISGDGNSFLITRVIPQITGEGIVEITVGSQEEIDGTITWNDPWVFEIGVDRFISPRCSGNYFCYIIEAESPNNFAFSGITIEYRVGGKRRRSFR